MINLALIGDHNPGVTAHRAIPLSLDLAAKAGGYELAYTWVRTDTLGPEAPGQLSKFQGLWCVPASPYASLEGALGAIRFAREGGRPFLGTCGGFQHALLEYARTVLGMSEAAHAELAPGTPDPLISPLACSLVEQAGTIILEPGTRMAGVCGSLKLEETYHCRYGLNPRFEAALVQGKELRISGRDREGEVRAVELASHPFFVATLFQPERAALRGRLHPLIRAFVAAAAQQGST